GRAPARRAVRRSRRGRRGDRRAPRIARGRGTRRALRGAHHVRRPRRSDAHRARPYCGRPGRDRADARSPGHRHAGTRGNPAAPPPRHRFRIGAVTLEVSGPRLRLALGALPPLTERRVTVPGRLALPEIGRTLEATLSDADGFVIPDDPGRVVFDADLLPTAFVVRPRRAGDRFTPFGGVV